MTTDSALGVHGPPAFDPALAALPLSLVRADAGAPITGIAGSDGWTTRVEEAVRAGSRAIVVDAPVPQPPVAVLAAARLAEERGALVRLVRRWADDPALDGLDPVDPPQLVDVTATAPGSAAATLTEVRALLRRLFVVAPAWETVAGVPGSLAATSRVQGAPVVVSAVDLPGVARARIRIITPTGRLALDLDDDLGRPARVTRDDADGSVVAAEVWETPLRRALREVVETVRIGPRGDATDLRDFADDVAVQPSDASPSDG